MTFPTNSELAIFGINQLIGERPTPYPFQPAIANAHQNMTDEQVAARYRQMWNWYGDARADRYGPFTLERLADLGERIAAAKKRHGIG